MTTTKIICPNCKYEGKPKYRTSAVAWWLLWLFVGGLGGVIGIVFPPMLLVPFLLFIAAIVATVINSTKGTIYCPRCHFANVIPQTS